MPFLKPVGDYALARLPTPNGRRRGKKHLKGRKIGDNDAPGQEQPEICAYVNIGFNSNVRTLEALVGGSETSTSASKQSQECQTGLKEPKYPPFVLVYRSALPAPISQSLPVLVAAASHHTGNAQPIRLVELSARSEAAVSAALGLPRVSVLSVQHDAPGVGPLLRLIQEHIKPVEVPWLKEAPFTAYLPVNVNAVEATIGSKKLSRKRKRASG